jgi:hypothetical protein
MEKAFSFAVSKKNIERECEMLWITDDPQLLLLLFRTLLNMNHNVQKTKDKGTNNDLQNTNTDY